MAHPVVHAEEAHGPAPGHQREDGEALRAEERHARVLRRQAVLWRDVLVPVEDDLHLLAERLLQAPYGADRDSRWGQVVTHPYAGADLQVRLLPVGEPDDGPVEADDVLDCLQD